LVAVQLSVAGSYSSALPRVDQLPDEIHVIASAGGEPFCLSARSAQISDIPILRNFSSDLVRIIETKLAPF
jgi:hypothetical protein